MDIKSSELVYPLPNLPCALPSTSISDLTDLKPVAISCVNALNSLGLEHLQQDAIWRDSFALTGTLRTFYSTTSVETAWRQTAKATKPTSFTVEGTPRLVRIATTAWVDIGFVFETDGPPATICSGTLSVVPSDDGWKIWVIRTVLEQLKSQPDVDVLRPVPEAFTHLNGDSTQHPHFDCVVIGGGQCGLSMGGRLKALGISYVVLDRNDKVGGSWGTRYDSFKLHTTREYSHLPFERTFAEPLPEYLTKDQLAEGYQRWVRKYGINVWLSTTFISGAWGSDQKTWSLKAIREGREILLTCSYIVYAVGAAGQYPLMPTYAGRETFHGIVLHSVDYKNSFDWAGKHGIVVGCANTGHDVAEDMLAAGLASVTLIQRSRTYVLPGEYLVDIYGTTYNSSVPTEVADRAQYSSPIALSRLLALGRLHAMAREQPDRFDALEKAGFKTERYGDIIYQISHLLGGHYVDVGASAKIARGEIKVKSDSLPVRYTSDGLELSNGDHLPADVIVFATGFIGNLKQIVEGHFGKEIAEQTGDFWGLDNEGELRGAYKPTGHPGFWYHGGALGQARYFSRFIALQIKAKLLGAPLPVYSETPR